MRLRFLIPLLVPVWALAPWFGSPASMWVMPLVAAIAAALTARPLHAVGASLASLAILCAPFLAMGVALFAFHAPFVALYAYGGARAKGWYVGHSVTAA